VSQVLLPVLLRFDHSRDSGAAAENEDALIRALDAFDEFQGADACLGASRGLFAIAWEKAGAAAVAAVEAYNKPGSHFRTAHYIVR